MKNLLLVLMAAALFGWGCGHEVIDASVMPVPAPSPVMSDRDLRGGLSFLLVRVAYADTPSSITDDQMTVLSMMLSSFVNRNSTGLAYVVSQRQDITLPGTAASYAAASTQAILDQGGPIFPVQTDCLNAVPDPHAYRLFLLPATGPVVYVGYGTTQRQPRFAWVSSLPFAPDDLFSLPIPHEVGHMFGLQHTERGVMSGSDAAAQRDWDGFFTEQQRASLGWP